MKTIKEYLIEGKMASTSNPKFTKAYGNKTFGDLYDKLITDIPEIMKNVTGWYIDNNDERLILKLITKKDEIIGVGLLKDKLMPLSVKAIFKTKDMSK